MKSKTVILSNPNNKDKSRGILSIYEEDDIFKCRIRLYEHENLSRYCKIGIYQDEVFSANLLEKNGTYLSSIVGDFDLDKDFYAAIVDTEKDNTPILAGGTYGGMYFSENLNTETLKNDPKDFEICEEEFLENNQEDNLFEQSAIQEIHSEPKENPALSSTNKIKDVLVSITEQFDYVFKHYPEDEILNNMLPQSNFVKIAENDDSYSIGVLKENSEIKYICYAKFCTYNAPVPSELGLHYQWLPIDSEDPLSDGYYIVFQDSKDLKIVEL